MPRGYLDLALRLAHRVTGLETLVDSPAGVYERATTAVRRSFQKVTCACVAPRRVSERPPGSFERMSTPRVSKSEVPGSLV